MKKFRIFAAVLAVAMCLGMLAGCGGETAGTGGDTVKIGLIAPLTGDVATYGTAVEKGASLYVEQLNEQGGINGKQVELIKYDDKGSATEATNAYQRLVSSDDVVAVLGAVTSTPTIAVAKLSASDNVPVITATSTHPEATAYGDNVFRTCFLDPFQSSTMATFAKEDLGAKTAAVIYNNSDSYSTGLYEAFVEKANEIGLEIVAEESYAKGDTDFKSQLTKIAAVQPDVIFTPDYYNTIYMIASQARQVGCTGTLLGPDGVDGILNIPGIDTAAVEGIYFCNHYFTGDESEVVQNFLSAFRAKYNEDPNSFAALAYDSMGILCDALKTVSESRELDSSAECRQAIIDALKDTEVTGVTGHLTFDEDNNPNKTCTIIKIENGAYTLMKKSGE